MEPIDYGDLLRRWSVLIIAGMLVAALMGYRAALRSREAPRLHYVGTAGVVVHYVTPPGVPYIATLSTHTQAEVLSARVTEPGALSRVAGRAHVALSQVQRVSAAVDPQKPLITIQVLGTTPRAAATVAQGLAQYVAGVETQQVQAQAASLSRTVASAMAQAQQRWLAAQAHYYVVCGCIADQYHGRVDPATLARLRAELDVLQADYAAAAGHYTALRSNSMPVATVLPGSVSAVRAPAASPLQAVLLAAVVGLVLSSGLATLLDVRRRVLPARAAARRHQPTAASRRAPWNQGLERESEHDGRQAGATQDPRARLCALIPQLSEHDVELLLRMAERLLARPDVSPAMGAARPRVAPPEEGTPATPAPPHLVDLLSDPAVRAILENLAPYSEDVRVALRVARALDRA